MVGEARRSASEAEIPATEVATTAEVTIVAAAEVVAPGIATAVASVPAVCHSGLVTAGPADTGHSGEQRRCHQVRPDTPCTGHQRRLPPGLGVPAAGYRPAGDHTARVVVSGVLAGLRGGLVLMALDGDRTVFRDSPGLLLARNGGQLGPRVQTERGARRPYVVQPLKALCWANRYCCTDLACSTCDPAAVKRSAASDSACRAAGSSRGSSEYTWPPSRSTQRLASACASSSERAVVAPFWR